MDAVRSRKLRPASCPAFVTGFAGPALPWARPRQAAGTADGGAAIVAPANAAIVCTFTDAWASGRSTKGPDELREDAMSGADEGRRDRRLLPAPIATDPVPCSDAADEEEEEEEASDDGPADDPLDMDEVE